MPNREAIGSSLWHDLAGVHTNNLPVPGLFLTDGHSLALERVENVSSKSFFHNCFIYSVQKAVWQFSTQCQSAQFADDSVVDSAVAPSLPLSLSGQRN